MRILFDQGTPAPLRYGLAGHVVETAYERGWSSLDNGDLLAAAEGASFDLVCDHRPKSSLPTEPGWTPDWYRRITHNPMAHNSATPSGNRGGNQLD
jgi:hypothetical protein